MQLSPGFNRLPSGADMNLELMYPDRAIIALDDLNYLCLPITKLPKDSGICSAIPTPVTVVPLPTAQKTLTKHWLDAMLKACQGDDEFTKVFGSVLLFTIGKQQAFSIHADAVDALQNRNIQFSHVSIGVGADRLASGPHLIYNSKLWQAFRLHDDISGAFQIALRPTSDCNSRDPTYQKMSISGKSYQTIAVAVPSRSQSLMTGASAKYPLAGMRFAVKDLFRMKGLKTSLCNRAYLDINQRADRTAAAVSVFVDAGAHVLGMTKLSSMISREEPTEAVDYHMAFNPRGDGYQSPAGSSSGSAAAVASYPWIDFAIGTDTSGSGRRPALVNGVFQLRPTHDAIKLCGMTPTFLDWDTPCLFARDITSLKQLATVWYASYLQPTCRSKTTRFILPSDYFPVQNTDQMRIVNEFLNDFSTFLKVELSTVSIAECWKSSPPPDVGSQSVQEYLADTVVNTYYHDFYHSTDAFRSRYRKNYSKEPFVTPFNHWRWNLGKQVSEADYREGLERLSVYKRWFLDVVMKQHTHQSLLILPVANVEPNYRDSPPPQPVRQEGFDQLFIPPILGSPDIFVPLGECEYESRISCQREFLPVGIDIVGLPGQDLALIQAVQECLIACRRPVKVQTGSRI